MKTTFALLALFVCSFGRAQTLENLYLISGHPYNDTDEEFESYLWHYTEDRLDTVTMVSSKNDFLENVKVYPEQNLAVLHKTNSIRRMHLGDNHRLLFINYGYSVHTDEVQIDIQGSFSYYHSLEKDILLDVFTQDREIQFIKVDVRSKTIEEATIEDFVFSELTGIPGGMIHSKDYLLVYSNEKDGVLEIPLVGDRNKRPKFPYLLPEKYQFGSYERHVVSVNNSKLFLLHGDYEEAGPKLGKSDLIYLNKEDSSWHKLVIPGNIQKPRGFGHWLAGYVFNDHIEGKKLPGSEIWTPRESGLSPQERWNYYPGEDYAYAPGVLYFYHAGTQEYFELETNQADSEVILIEDNTVIYRVYNKLYKAPIVDGKALGESELLLKDDRVPDIHWAFFSGN